MLEGTSRGRGLYDSVRDLVTGALGERTLAIIAFGSYVYRGGGGDVDLLIVVRGSLNPREKLSLEAEIRSLALRRGISLDPHIMSLEDLRANLAPDTFLSGLALGYDVILDREDVESLIISFLSTLSRYDYVLYNRYGRWNLGRMAGILLRRKLRARAGGSTNT